MKTVSKVSFFFIIAALISFTSVHQFSKANIETTTNKAIASGLAEVSYVHPVSIDNTDLVQFNTRLEAIEQANIFARADGYVEERFVDIGDKVSKGDVLVKLSSPELEQQIQQARAEIERQKALVDLTQKMTDRFTKLRDSGAVNAAEVDEKEAEFKVAEATLASYQARLEQLLDEFSYTTITAPFDGLISRRHIDRGDRISRTDAIPMFRLVNVAKLRVLVDVPQTQFYSLDHQADAILSLPEMVGQDFTVQFDRLSGELEADLGTMRIEFLVDNAERLLSAGLKGHISIATLATQNQFLIPVNAVKFIDGEPAVMVVDNDNKVVIKPISAGRYTNNQVQIQAGLNSQDKVIVNPNALLQPGEEVEARNGAKS